MIEIREQGRKIKSKEVKCLMIWISPVTFFMFRVYTWGRFTCSRIMAVRKYTPYTRDRIRTMISV